MEVDFIQERIMIIMRNMFSSYFGNIRLVCMKFLGDTFIGVPLVYNELRVFVPSLIYLCHDEIFIGFFIFVSIKLQIL